MVFVGSGLVMCFVAAAASQASVQIFRREDILAKVQALKVEKTKETESFQRGTIYSSDGKVLAQSEDVYELSLHYRNLPKSPGFYMALAHATGISAPELRNPSLDPTAKSRFWKAKMTAVQAEEVRRVQTTWSANGVDLKPTLSRIYPLAESLSNIVGTVRNGEPVAGFEKSMDPVLKGQGKISQNLVGASEDYKRRIEDAAIETPQARDITLTIDSELQQIAAEAVRGAVERGNAASGCAIILKPNTGDILACADYPSYDPKGSAAKGSDMSTSTMRLLEPGSMFKLITLGKALNDKKITLNSTFESTSSYPVGGGKFIKNHDGKAYGIVDAEKAIAVSCNVTAAKWALLIGHKSYSDFITKLGILERPDLGLTPAANRFGSFNKKDTSRMLLANLGFGQAIGTLPISLVGAFGMLANNGVLVKPRLVKEVGGIPIPPVKGEQLLSADTCSKVLLASEAVINRSYGTGAHLQVPGVRLAGKTGTAQKLDRRGKLVGYVANFVGFVPAKKPQYVILVMVDQPKTKNYYGGAVAGPAFAEIVRNMISADRILVDQKLMAEERYNQFHEQKPAVTAARD